MEALFIATIIGIALALIACVFGYVYLEVHRHEGLSP